MIDVGKNYSKISMCITNTVPLLQSMYTNSTYRHLFQEAFEMAIQFILLIFLLTS